MPSTAPSIVPLLLAYAAMVLVQSHGADLIGLAWGADARAAAVAQNVDDVQPDAAVAVLCGGYASAHWDVTSNILHAAGMCTTVYLALRAVALVAGQCWSKAAHSILWMPPTYYLPAWVGHLAYQKDIPAVFTYANTLRGWAVGEYCAFVDLLEGGVVHGVNQLVPSALAIGLLIVAIEQVSGGTTKSLGGTTTVDGGLHSKPKQA
jgi:hypothetical protein